MAFLPYLHRVAARESLTIDEARDAMAGILSGEATPVQIAGFLVALRMKGETADEVTGFAQAMRAMAHPVRPLASPKPLIDTCGTGGDGASTFNISTVTAFVLAGAGLRVAKHGNRSASSHCGSADLMEHFGIAIALDPEQMARAIDQTGIGFLFAPAIHSAMKYAGPVRAELKMRTVFNFLGPLTNPAGANVQLTGAPSLEIARLMAEALAGLGLERGLVVHGSDGLDEITTTGPTTIFEICGGSVKQSAVTPDDFGVPQADPAALKCASKEENFRTADSVLDGAAGPQRDIVLVNAAAALHIAGVAGDYNEGVRQAAESIDSGAARRKVVELAEFTRGNR
jgi:anthranilate phosphoribosyltransferase